MRFKSTFNRIQVGASLPPPRSTIQGRPRPNFKGDRHGLYKRYLLFCRSTRKTTTTEIFDRNGFAGLWSIVNGYRFNYSNRACLVMSHVIGQAELLEIFGYSRPGDLQKALNDQGIKYHLGKGGRIVTTLEAINMPLIGTTPTDDQKVKFI